MCLHRPQIIICIGRLWLPSMRNNPLKSTSNFERFSKTDGLVAQIKGILTLRATDAAMLNCWMHERTMDSVPYQEKVEGWDSSHL